MQDLADELPWLLELAAEPLSIEVRRRYSTVLRERGDEQRAEILLETSRALDPTTTGELVSLLDDLPDHQQGWARLVGARLLASMAAHGLTSHGATWLELARPAVSVALGREDPSPPPGSSYFWGDPDLPADADWPTFAECSRFFGAVSEIDPASRCHFVGQFDLADLSRSPAASGLPRDGLLSIFAFEETEHLGISEVVLRWSSADTELVRVPHPHGDEDNPRYPPRRLTLSHALTLPERYDGPWSQALAVAPNDRAHDDSADAAVRSDSGGSRFGLFGHLEATTGGDPAPTRDWQRLLCVPTDPDFVVWHHIGVLVDDLRLGRVDRSRSLWVDLDG